MCCYLHSSLICIEPGRSSGNRQVVLSWGNCGSDLNAEKLPSIRHIDSLMGCNHYSVGTHIGLSVPVLPQKSACDGILLLRSPVINCKLWEGQAAIVQFTCRATNGVVMLDTVFIQINRLVGSSGCPGCLPLLKGSCQSPLPPPPPPPQDSMSLKYR